MKRVVFRADGNSQIGLGHLYRVISLAGILNEEFDTLLVTQSIPDKLRSTILNHFRNVVELNPGSDNSLDINNNTVEIPFDLDGIITENDIVVLDGYNFSCAYQIKIQEFQSRVVVIDDLELSCLTADVVINHCINTLLTDYSAINSNVKQFYLGVDYAILRRGFYNQAIKKINKQNLEKAFVCLGGSDSANITLGLVNNLKMISEIKEINVVIGAANINADVSNAKDIKINIFKNLDEREIISLMNRCDFGVVPASNTAYEAICCGLPLIIGYYAKNQMRFYAELCKCNNIIGIESFDNSINSNISSAYSALVSGYKSLVSNIIDGRQQQRLREIFVNLAN